MHAFRWISICGVLALAACASPTKQRPEDVQQARRDVAMEIERICGLPQAERDAELAKLQKTEGLVLYCGREAEKPKTE
jgi:hypothetical protein